MKRDRNFIFLIIVILFTLFACVVIIYNNNLNYDEKYKVVYVDSLDNLS